MTTPCQDFLLVEMAMIFFLKDHLSIIASTAALHVHEERDVISGAATSPGHRRVVSKV
jgi:hypothetical protein